MLEAIAPDVVEPFASAAEIRAAHLKLMSEARQGTEAAKLKPRIDSFLERAQATGALLREHADRDAAQAAIDYWAAWLLTNTPFDAAADSFLLAEYNPAPVLQREAARSAEETGTEFDPEALTRLIDDAARDSSSLPLLRFLLAEPAGRRDGKKATAETPGKVGSAAEALERTAEAAFDTLDAEDQTAAKLLFLELVEDSKGARVRRRLSRETLARVSDKARADRVLAAFVDARLIQQTPGDEPEQDRFQIAFDALLGGWPRLRAWLDERRQRSGTVSKLIGAAKLWKESGRQTGYLLTGDALTDALQYREADPDLTELIVASQKRGARQTRFLWGTIAALVVLLIAALSFGLIAWNLREQEAGARREEATARREEKTARESADAARGALESESDNAKTIIADLQTKLADLQQRLDARDAGPVEAETEVVGDDVARAYGTFQGNPGGRIPLAGKEGFIWIGSVDTTSLRTPDGSVVPAVEAASGKSYVLDKNLAFRDAPSAKGSPAPEIGMLLAGTRVLALRVDTLRSRSNSAQYWMRVRVLAPDTALSATGTATVYVQFARAPREEIQLFSKQLREFGYNIPGEERLESAIGKNEVRYFHPEDEAAAKGLAANVTQVASTLRLELRSETRAVSLTSYKGKKPPMGVLELWIDLPKSEPEPPQ